MESLRCCQLQFRGEFDGVVAVRLRSQGGCALVVRGGYDVGITDLRALAVQERVFCLHRPKTPVPIDFSIVSRALINVEYRGVFALLASFDYPRDNRLVAEYCQSYDVSCRCAVQHYRVVGLFEILGKWPGEVCVILPGSDSVTRGLTANFAQVPELEVFSPCIADRLVPERQLS